MNIPSHEHFADIILAEQNNFILMKYSISIIFCIGSIILYNTKMSQVYTSKKYSVPWNMSYLHKSKCKLISGEIERNITLMTYFLTKGSKDNP